ncbi:unnamed protein product [Toxocara canis]|nr:unnamed protein product [Toxocara canis]
MELIAAYSLAVVLFSSGIQISQSSPINYFYDNGNRLRQGVNIAMQSLGFGANENLPSQVQNRYRKSGMRDGRSIQDIDALRKSIRTLQQLNRLNGIKQVFG